MNTELTDEQKRMKIAEACGWEYCGTSNSGEVFGYMNEELDVVPDYLNSLDAMHEAEKALTKKQRERYVMILREIYGAISCDLNSLIAANAAWGFSTASQRAEAFLLTINA